MRRSTRAQAPAGTRLSRAVAATTSPAAAGATHGERHRQKNSRRDVILGGQDGLVSIIGHLMSLLPFLVLARGPAVILAIVLSAVVLFGVGVYAAVTLVGDWRVSGLRMVVIGLGAASAGFLIGRLFHAAGA